MKTLRPLSTLVALKRLDRIVKRGGSLFIDGKRIIERGLAGRRKNKR